MTKISIRSAEAGGTLDRINTQLAKGKLTARHRLQLLLDPSSPFDEIDKIHALDPANGNEGVIVGVGRIWGRPAVVFSQDFTVKGGSLGAVHASKIGKGLETAWRQGCPVIGLNDSGGARIQEGVDALAGYA